MNKEDYFKYYVQGSAHYLIPKYTFEELFNEMENWREEAQKLKKQLDCALKLLSDMNPPCEIDGFMDNHTNYCEINCGVDEEIFKKCWLLYIEDKLKEVE